VVAILEVMVVVAVVVWFGLVWFRSAVRKGRDRDNPFDSEWIRRRTGGGLYP
jgi:uncharacterized membrane protein